MSASTYEELLTHIRHDLECVGYGRLSEAPDNVAIECLDCGCILLDFDRPPGLLEVPE